jgi:cytoskeleton protein RodZ
MPSIGETLRRERLRRGLSLEQIASQTKIGLHLLEALEADQYERLPGGVFAKNFARQYARLLEIDDDEIRAALKQQFDEPVIEPIQPDPQNSPRHLPHLPPLEDFRDRLRSDSSISAFFWVILTMLACAGAYSVWQKGRQPAAVSEPVAAVHPAPKPEVAQPASLDKGKSAERHVEPKSEFRPAEITESGTIKAPETPKPPAEPSPAPPASPLSASPGSASPGSTAAVRVALTATAPVWVSAKSDGTRAFLGTLAAQEKKQLEASKKITLWVGNAAALEIALNGKRVGPFGGTGEIQMLVLTTAGAHVVPRTPPTPSPTSGDPAVPAGERP